MKRWLVWTLALALALPACARQEGAAPQEQQAPLNTFQQKASYCLGVDYVKNLERMEVEVEAVALVQGLRDALGEGPLALTDEERQDIMAEFRLQLTQQKAQNREEQAAKNVETAAKNEVEGKAFLAENETKPGIVTTTSGLQYKVLVEGDGPSPSRTDRVKVHYRGTLIDGTEFDSSYSRGEPAVFGVGGVIKGWTEALQLMKVGSKYELYIPAELAYGEQARGDVIGPNSTLIFEVELLGIEE